MCDCDYHRSLDIVTPRNVYLSGYYKRSFAFYSIKHREPVILTQLIDTLSRNKQQIVEQLGPDSAAQLKEIIGDISKLKYEIQTNKEITKITDTESDAALYNSYIDKISSEEGRSTHYHTIWLLAECYMYRRLREAFVTRSAFREFDYFYFHKEETYLISLPLIQDLAKYLTAITKDLGNDTERLVEKQFLNLLKINLWGNKCDLSLSLGKVNSNAAGFDADALEKNVLVDDCNKLFNYLYYASLEKSLTVDIVFDNAGYEVFTDLCLANFLTTKNIVSKVRFHVKSFPWFISDVTKKDYYWILQQLMKNKNEHINQLGNAFNSDISSLKWSVHEHDFWTLPHDFTYMDSVAPDLYEMLSTSSLIIFKGDLNYRKLMGERNWDPTTPFETALQNFAPAKLCAFRTIKAHVVSGLKEGEAEELQQKEPDWMEIGKYGLIQFSQKIVPLEST